MHPKLSKRQKWLLFSLVIAASIAGLTLFFGDEDTPKYITVPVTRGDIEDVVTASGALEAKNQVEVKISMANSAEQLKKIHVVLGQQVKKGQLLAELDTLLQKNALLKKQAMLASNLTQKRIEQIACDSAKQKFLRQQLLIKSGATSLENLENAKSDLATTELKIASQDKEIQQTRLDIESAMRNLKDARITAPISGTVAYINGKEGQFLATNSDGLPSLLLLAQLDVMTVRAQISEADVLLLKKGQPVYFTILGKPNERFHASIKDIALFSKRKADDAVYYDISFDIPNPKYMLRIGMSVQVTVPLKQVKNVLLIPSLALEKKNKDGSYTVQVLDKKGKLVLRRVKIGLNNRIQAQVLEGLKLNDQVVIGEEGSENTPSASKTSFSVR